MDTKSKTYLSWDDINKLVDQLTNKITTQHPQIDSIAGLPRGGLIPAVMLSHRLALPLVEVENISKNTLIVDDICDSGKTLKQFQFEENIYTAVIHYKKSAIYKPNFYWDYADENKWIVYPWERKDSKTIPDYATKGK